MSALAESAIAAPPFDADALAALMRANGLTGTATIDVERLAGGQSNPTYRVSDGRRRWVLRKKPPGELLASAHAVDREYRVMKALAASAVPVPDVQLYCDDASIVGTPFYLMDFLDGRVLVDQALPGMAPAERAAIYAEMNRVLAALHQVDPTAVGLGDFGKAGNYFGRQIGRWTRQYQAGGERIAALDALIDWLPGHIPTSDETTIVHGDYRLDNLIFHPTEARILGVIDWELATLGHPLADVSYHCMSWHIAPALWRGIGGLDLAALGIPSESDYIARYCEATGRAGIEHWNFYLAYNLFRMAAIMHGIAQRAQAGNATAADAVEVGRKATPLAELGWQFALRYNAEHRAGGR